MVDKIGFAEIPKKYFCWPLSEKFRPEDPQRSKKFPKISLKIYEIKYHYFTEIITSNIASNIWINKVLWQNH